MRKIYYNEINLKKAVNRLIDNQPLGETLLVKIIMFGHKTQHEVGYILQAKYRNRIKSDK